MQVQSNEQKRQQSEQAKKQHMNEMPEAAKIARTNFEGRVKVTFGPEAFAIVVVKHVGEPHPRGFSAVIESFKGVERIDGERRGQITDAAIDFAKDKKAFFPVEMYSGEEAAPAEAGTQSKNPEEVPPQGNPAPPAGATSDSPVPSGQASSGDASNMADQKSDAANVT